MTILNETIQAMINNGTTSDDIREVLTAIDNRTARINELTAQRDTITAELATLTDTVAINRASENVTALTSAIELERIELVRLVAISSGRAKYHQFGVEIEFVIPEGYDHRSFRNLIAPEYSDAGLPLSRKTGHYNSNGDYSKWAVKYDSSVDAPSYDRKGEMVSPKLRGEQGLADMVKAVDILERHGATVNISCGLHVHFNVNRTGVNASQFTFNHIRRIAQTYVLNETLITSTLAPSRRGGHYCSFTDSTFLERMASYGETESVDYVARDIYQARECGFNFSSAFRKCNTIEFRAHGGTVDAVKIEMWVRFLHLIVKSAETTRDTNKSYSTIKDMVNTLSDKTDMTLEHAITNPNTPWAQMVKNIKQGTDDNTTASPYRSRAKAQLAGKEIGDYMQERAEFFA